MDDDDDAEEEDKEEKEDKEKKLKSILINGLPGQTSSCLVNCIGEEIRIVDGPDVRKQIWL